MTVSCRRHSGHDAASGGNGDDLFLYTQPQLLGGSSTSDHFDGGSGFNTLALRPDPATPAADFSDVAPPSGDLGAQLQKADLFGLV